MKYNLTLKKFLIAGGNSTLLVWNSPKSERDRIIKRFLGCVEKVGFVTNNRLAIMGDELCINGTIAFASQLDTMCTLQTRGLASEVEYQNKKDCTTISFSSPIVVQKKCCFIVGNRLFMH